MRRLFLCAVLCVAGGCGGGPADQLIPLEQVPEDMLKVAREKLPEVKFDQALKRKDGSVEVRGKDPRGKVRDIDFSASGEILEIE